MRRTIPDQRCSIYSRPHQRCHARSSIIANGARPGFLVFLVTVWLRVSVSADTARRDYISTMYDVSFKFHFGPNGTRCNQLYGIHGTFIRVARVALSTVASFCAGVRCATSANRMSRIKRYIALEHRRQYPLILSFRSVSYCKHRSRRL